MINWINFCVSLRSNAPSFLVYWQSFHIGRWFLFYKSESLFHFSSFQTATFMYYYFLLELYSDTKTNGVRFSLIFFLFKQRQQQKLWIKIGKISTNSFPMLQNWGMVNMVITKTMHVFYVCSVSFLKWENLVIYASTLEITKYQPK